MVNYNNTKMRSFLISIIILIAVNFMAINASVAQATKPSPSKTQIEGKKPTNTVTPQPAASALKAQVAPEVSKCNCSGPAVDAIQKAYVSLEEDEWPAAIKSCTNALAVVANLQKTCKCPEINDYKNITQGFLNYAKGGNFLDGQEDPNCDAVTKLYLEGIKLLDDTLPKIRDQKLKENVQNIRDYSKEELEFVKDECAR